MKKKNLLIVHHGALGDVVATFPIITRLKKNYGRTDILCQLKLGELAQSLQVVDTHFPLESAIFASLFTDNVDPMVKSILCSYEVVLLFSNSVQLESVIGNITEKQVYRISPKPGIKRDIHITDYILSQLASYRPFGSIAARTSHSALLPPNHPDRRDLHYDSLKVVLHPGAGSIKKCWPVSNFINLASLLNLKGKQAVFVLGPAEHDMAEALERQDEHKSNIFKIDNLIQLTSILKTAGGFVGNDSGVSHLAAFLGVPTVVVFGPSDPVIWRPTGRSVCLIRPDLDCQPCFETNNQCKELECFDGTTPKMVLDAFMGHIDSDHATN